MIRKILKEQLNRAVKEAGFKEVEPQVLPTSDPKFGDYYSTVALKLNKQKPQDAAKLIVAKLPKEDDIFKAEITPKGFINFTLSDKFVQNQVKEIIQSGENYGKLEKGKGKKARVEFVSANPTGPLHIGNARGGPLGDTITNVLEFAGYKVLREYINNDRGNQVTELGRTLASKAELIKTKDEELTYKGEYTQDLAQKVKKEIGKAEHLSESEIIEKVGEMGTEMLYKDILSDTYSMGVRFDNVVSESDLQKKLPDILKNLEGRGLLEKHDGATWFLLGKKFDVKRDAVVVKSDGSYTYFATDIVYHKEKFESGADLIIDVFGSNTSGHVPKLEALVEALGFDRSKLKVILYQFVRVKRGNEVIKMSKRAGNFVTAKEIIDEVGADAFRFFLLMFDPSTHMDFDLERAKKESAENPVYYVQYAHARANSILKKAQEEGYEHKKLGETKVDLLKEPQELALIKQLIKFPELTEDISKNLAVHLLTSYSIALADIFHKYYEKVRVLGEEKETTESRLALIKATKVVLRNALQLMGISAPEHMEKRA